MPYFLVQTPSERDTPLDAAGWEGAEKVLWTIGRPLPQSLPARLSFRAEGPLEHVSDLPVNSLGIPVLSKALWGAIRGDEQPPAEVIETVVLDAWEANVIRRTHVALNLLAMVRGSVDFNASDVDVAPWAPNHILHARTISVRCPSDTPAMFRLDEFTQVPVLSEEAAQRVRALRPRGVSVVHTDEYRGART